MRNNYIPIEVSYYNSPRKIDIVNITNIFEICPCTIVLIEGLKHQHIWSKPSERLSFNRLRWKIFSQAPNLRLWTWNLKSFQLTTHSNQRMLNLTSQRVPQSARLHSLNSLTNCIHTHTQAWPMLAELVSLAKPYKATSIFTGTSNLLYSTCTVHSY